MTYVAVRVRKGHDLGACISNRIWLTMMQLALTTRVNVR
jgi:hypothetical protein